MKQCCLCTEAPALIVRLQPCGCSLCNVCMIQFLTETRLNPVWECWNCHKVVLSHNAPRKRMVRLESTVAAAASQTSKVPAAAPGADTTNNNPVAINGVPTTPNVAILPTATLADSTARNTKNSSTPKKPRARKRKQTTKPKVQQSTSTGDQPDEVVEKKKDTKVRKPHKSFEERVQALLAFKAEHGHVQVPWRYSAGQGLGEWVKNVRRGVKKITQEERKQLNKLGFVWETRSNQEDREWNERLEKLKAYKRRFGDCNIPWKWEEDKSLAEVRFHVDSFAHASNT